MRFARRAIFLVSGFIGLIAIFLVGVPGIPSAHADSIPPNQKPVSYCFRIANLDKYPDYTVLAYFTKTRAHTPTPPTVRAIKPGECVKPIAYYDYGHHLSVPDLYALKTSQYRPNDPPAKPTGAPTLVVVATILHPVTLIDKGDPRTGVEDVLTITKLGDQSFQLQRTAVRYRYADGQTRVFPATDAAPDNLKDLSGSSGLTRLLKPDSPGNGVFDTLWYLAIPLAAALGIGAVFLSRRRR